MKKIYFSIFVLCILSLSTTSAQTVTAITYTPSAPTTTDSITFYFNCYFAYSGCEGTATYLGMSGDTLKGSALHCMGMLAAICYDDDTLKIPPLPAGQYTFEFILSTGSGPTCLVDVIPPDTAYATFDVISVAGIGSPAFEQGMQVSPNPSNGDVVISWENGTGEEGVLKVYNALGQFQQSTGIQPGTKRMQLRLSPGVYFLVTESNDGKIYRCKAVVN